VHFSSQLGAESLEQVHENERHVVPYIERLHDPRGVVHLGRRSEELDVPEGSVEPAPGSFGRDARRELDAPPRVRQPLEAILTAPVDELFPRAEGLTDDPTEDRD
jgi:hypothetical protein